MDVPHEGPEFLALPRVRFVRQPEKHAIPWVRCLVRDVDGRRWMSCDFLHLSLCTLVLRTYVISF